MNSEIRDSTHPQGTVREPILADTPGVYQQRGGGAHTNEADQPFLAADSSFLVADPSWASRLADFDRRIFKKDAWPRSIWEHELLMEDRSYLVLPAEPEPLRSLPGVYAVAGMRFAQDCELLTLAVDPHMRRRGIARALVCQLIAQARQCGGERVFLEVRAHAYQVQALYASLGFAPLYVRRRYYSDDDALVMKCDLCTLEQSNLEQSNLDVGKPDVGTLSKAAHEM